MLTLNTQKTTPEIQEQSSNKKNWMTNEKSTIKTKQETNIFQGQ
jgi:hypothetical protein